MNVKITPRKATDRGGIACMPLLANIPEGHADWKLTTCPVCGTQCWETPLLAVAKSQGAQAYCTMCALKAGMSNAK